MEIEKLKKALLILAEKRELQKKMADYLKYTNTILKFKKLITKKEIKKG